MQCLVPTVLAQGNSNTRNCCKNKLDFFCVTENKLGHFKQQPNEALPKFVGKQGLPCTSSLVLSSTADSALELPELGRGWSS